MLVLDVTEAGDPEPKRCAPGADVRTDLPRYCVYRNGERTDEPTEKIDTKVLETMVELEPGTRLPIGLRVDVFVGP